MKNRPVLSSKPNASAAKTAVQTQSPKKTSNWKKAILSNAVALASAGLGASAAFGACPGVQTAGTRTMLCTLTGTDSSTVTTTGSIKVSGPRAINITAQATNTTINNAGNITATGTYGANVNAIHFTGDFNGTITNTGTILGLALGSYYGSSYQSAVAATGIYVGDDIAAASSLTNSGTITGKAMAGAVGIGIEGDEYGLYSEGGGRAQAIGVNIDNDLDGTITNAVGGVIEGIAEGGSASATGIYVSSTLSATGSITNSGTIRARATGSSRQATAHGIYIDEYLEGSINNSGTVEATATGETGASATGIYLSSTMTDGSELINSGTISASATTTESSADAIGVFIYDMEGATFTNTATGAITATASGNYAEATGVYVTSMDGTSILTNAGTITASATGDTESATAYGIYVDSTLVSGAQLINSGTITATAEGVTEASAYGIYLSSTVEAGAQLVNSGTITASAAADSSNAGVYASGIYVDENLESILDNSGTITATATGAYAEADGIEVYALLVGTDNPDTIAPAAAFAEGSVEVMNGTTVQPSILHSGLITATATATDGAVARGIYVYDPVEGRIESSGDITATASSTGDGTVEAYGILTNYILRSAGSVENSGTISVSATSEGTPTGESSGIRAAGIYLADGMESGAILTNSGTINATASGVDVEADGIRTYALGVMTGTTTAPVEVFDVGAAQSTILNSGSITATATATTGSALARGIYVDSAIVHGGEGSADITATTTLDLNNRGFTDRVESSGDITATASSTGTGPVEAYGILINSIMTGTASVESGGTISVSATGGAALARVSTMGGSTSTGTGSGSIRAAGIYLSGGMEEGATLANSGTINATASGVDAEASGIRIDSIAAGAVSSSGNISVTGAPGVGAHGILINTTLAATGSVENSGTITASGPGGEDSGTAGIYIWNMDAAATLNNSGTITASPVEGVFSLYVEMGQGGSASNSGRLDGDIHLAGTSLANTGTVAMPVGVTGFIGGDYTQSGSGVLEVGVLSSSAGGYGQLVVEGTADVSANNQVSVNVSANDSLVDEEVIQDILSAGTLVTGAELTATDNSALWDFTAFNDGENNIDLGVIRGLFIADTVIENGPAWALGAAQSLDAIIEAGPEGDMDTVIGAFGALETSQEVAAAAAQTVPVLVAQGLQMASLSMGNLSNATINRLATQKGLASGDQLMTDRHLWIKPFGSSGEQDTRDGVPGYDVDNYGFIIGYDQALNDAWTVGGAIGYSDIESNLNSAELNHTLDVTSGQVAAYADWKLNQDMFVDLIGVLGSSDNDSQRRIRIGTLDRKAEGSYDSWYGRAYAGLGRNFVEGKVTMTPVVSTTYTYIEDDSYTEKGADSLNLDVEDNDIDSFILALDGRVAYAMNEGSLLTGHLGVGYDTIADAAVLTSTFVGGGPAFQTAGPEPDDTILQAGAGVELRATDTVDVFVNYEYEGRDDFENQSLIATVRWTF